MLVLQKSSQRFFRYLIFSASFTYLRNFKMRSRSPNSIFWFKRCPMYKSMASKMRSRSPETEYVFRAEPKGGGGKRGTCPPKQPQGILAPGKKLIIDLMIPKASCKNKSGTSANCSFQSNAYANIECKHGRALVKYGNLLSLIRYQTTPHCDKRDSKCQIEP